MPKPVLTADELGWTGLFAFCPRLASIRLRISIRDQAGFNRSQPGNRRITDGDRDGVALAAIQGLSRKMDEKDAEIQDLKQQNKSLEKRLENLESMLKSLNIKN